MVIYSLLIFIFCGILSWFSAIPENFLTENIASYKWIRSLKWFSEMLAGVLLSGFTVACSVLWQKKANNSRTRFSPAMLERFKLVIMSSLVLVLLLSLNEEIFSIGLKSKMTSMENAWFELNEAISTSRKFMDEGNPAIAHQYAKKAFAISSRSAEAAAIYKETFDALVLSKDLARYEKKEEEKIQKPHHNSDSLYTPFELIQKSKDAAERKQWFEAHYWAHLAVEACNGTNTNLDNAVEAANYAWSKLSVPVGYDNSEERAYYTKKREGYEAFNSGDPLKAYYVFLSLVYTPKGADDPDVVRFFRLAKEDVENQYFFFDETDHMRELSNNHKIHFSLSYPDSSKAVLSIENSMDIEKEGGLIRYLEGFSYVKYDSLGELLYSFYVPYAKVQAYPVSEISEEGRNTLGLNKKWSYVPFVTLQSVDRETEGIVSYPEFSFKETGLSYDILQASGGVEVADQNLAADLAEIVLENKSSMILPMSFDDFHLINEASAGASSMTLISLHRFLSKTKDYGFSWEVFAGLFMERTFMPFFLLILFILCAVVGWNYRIEQENAVFRFVWLLLIPVYGILMTIAFNCLKCLFNLASFVVISAFGSLAIAVFFLLMIVLLVIVSVMFMSRKV